MGPHEPGMRLGLVTFLSLLARPKTARTSSALLCTSLVRPSKLQWQVKKMAFMAAGSLLLNPIILCRLNNQPKSCIAWHYALTLLPILGRASKC